MSGWGDSLSDSAAGGWCGRWGGVMGGAAVGRTHTARSLSRGFLSLSFSLGSVSVLFAPYLSPQHLLG